MDFLQLSKRTNLNKEKKHNILEELLFQYDLYLMVLPALILVAIFSYAPMYGLSIAFKDYSIMDGIMKSPWTGLDHFKELFASLDFKRVFTNTLLIRC